jgi:4-hydroxy-3-polyprenylbenzoate decarboxylase
LIQKGKQNLIPPRVVEQAPCQEIVHTDGDVDVYEFPTPWWHEHDAAPYIQTTGGLITADSDTGYINMGMYRAMIVDKTSLSLNIRGSHPVGQAPETVRGYGSHTHILMNESRDRPTPIAIALGMDPLLTYVAAQAAPSRTVEHAEYQLAGGWRGEPTEVVRCKTNPLLVPAHAEIVLEGEVLVNERTVDGPHGEKDGFYRTVHQAFIMRVKCISHRKNPIHYGLICAPLEDYPKFMFSGGLRASLSSVPEVKDVYVSETGGGGHGLMAIVAVTAETPADVQRVVHAIHHIPQEYNLARKPRWLIIVDDDCDVRDWDDVMWRVGMGVMPDKDIQIGPRTDPIFHEALAELYQNKSSHIVVDATFRNKGFPMVNRVSRELRSKVAARWKEYGL